MTTIDQPSRSGFYKVFQYLCDCTDCNRVAREYNAAFSISFPRTGNFRHLTHKRSYDLHLGLVLVEKPGIEYAVSHYHAVPDSTTIISFSEEFHRSFLEEKVVRDIGFFKNPDHHAIAIKAKPHWELLVHLLEETLLHGRTTDQLKADILVIELLNEVVDALSGETLELELPHRLKKAHLRTVEKAKAYIAATFQEDVSLAAIGDHAHVSLFHFARVFKRFTGHSPYQYLLFQRLAYAALLVRTTDEPIGAIAFGSGFNSIEHFTTSFTAHYGTPPSSYRRAKSAAIR